MTAKKQESKGKLITKDKELTPAWYVAKRVLNVHNVTYNDMAEKLGVSVTTVHDLCNYAPNIVRVKQMADALGVSFFDFFDFTQEGKEAAVPNANLNGPTVPCSKAIITCPHCGETLITSLSLFPKS